MPTVMTVDWKHVLLDPVVFQQNGTYRVARVRGGLSAFPIPNRSSESWTSEFRFWKPSLAGYAGDYYDYEGRRFNFGFWSVKESVNGIFLRGSSNSSNEFSVSYVEGDIRIEATAIYYWNFGDGAGEHAVFIDAFDDTNQEFIAQDFVDVIPDNEKGTLTAEANEGRLSTEAIEKTGVLIRARSTIRNSIVNGFNFSAWSNEQDLSRFGPETVPFVDRTDIRLRRGSVIAALAHYYFFEHPFPRVNWPQGWRQLIGNPVDGPVFFVPPGGSPGPGPIGPWDTAAPGILLSSSQLGQLAEMIADLQKRIETLEKLR
jgi:hypothetical protein